MKLFLFGILAVLLYNSPDARNAFGGVLRKTADIVDAHDERPQSAAHFNIEVPNPFHHN